MYSWDLSMLQIKMGENFQVAQVKEEPPVQRTQVTAMTKVELWGGCDLLDTHNMLHIVSDISFMSLKHITALRGCYWCHLESQKEAGHHISIIWRGFIWKGTLYTGRQGTRRHGECGSLGSVSAELLLPLGQSEEHRQQVPDPEGGRPALSGAGLYCGGTQSASSNPLEWEQR